MTNSIVFLNVESQYLPSEDITVHLECKGNVTTNVRDWIGLFRVGWTSTSDYATYQWASVPGSGQKWSDLTVRFPGSSLPRPTDDGQKYQFCYINRDGTLYGSSTPFRITPTAIAVDVIDEGLEGSMVELRLTDRRGLSALPPSTFLRQQVTSNVVAKPVDQTNVRVPISHVNDQTAIEGTHETGTAEHTHEVAMKRVEGLVAQFKDKIGLLEKIFTSRSVANDQRLTAENEVLREQLMSWAGEMEALRERLETEESHKIKAEQQLSSVQQELAALKSSCLSLATKDNEGRIDHVGSATPVAVGDQLDAIEAFQIAYDNMEKYYRVSCADLDACQISLREAELKMHTMEQRCVDLEEHIGYLQKKCDNKEQELAEIKHTADDASIQLSNMKGIEQRLLDSENRCAILVSNEERYKRTIEELQHELKERDKGMRISSPTVISSDHNAWELRKCPICQSHFPHMPQDKFEQHVENHFPMK